MLGIILSSSAGIFLHGFATKTFLLFLIVVLFYTIWSLLDYSSKPYGIRRFFPMEKKARLRVISLFSLLVRLLPFSNKGLAYVNWCAFSGNVGNNFIISLPQCRS